MALPGGKRDCPSLDARSQIPIPSPLTRGNIGKGFCSRGTPSLNGGSLTNRPLIRRYLEDDTWAYGGERGANKQEHEGVVEGSKSGRRRVWESSQANVTSRQGGQPRMGISRKAGGPTRGDRPD